MITSIFSYISTLTSTKPPLKLRHRWIITHHLTWMYLYSSPMLIWLISVLKRGPGITVNPYCWGNVWVVMSLLQQSIEHVTAACHQCYSSPLSFQHIHIRARFLSLARSKLRLCSANHRAGYFSNLACDWLSIVCHPQTLFTYQNRVRVCTSRHLEGLYTIAQCVISVHGVQDNERSGPVFCLLLGVSSGCALPITGQVTSVTWPVIGWA